MVEEVEPYDVLSENPKPHVYTAATLNVTLSDPVRISNEPVAPIMPLDGVGRTIGFVRSCRDPHVEVQYRHFLSKLGS